MKNLVTGAIIAIILFWVVTDPSQAADTVHSLWHIIQDVLTGIGNFFHAVSGNH